MTGWHDTMTGRYSTCHRVIIRTLHQRGPGKRGYVILAPTDSISSRRQHQSWGNGLHVSFTEDQQHRPQTDQRHDNADQPAQPRDAPQQDKD